MHALDAVAKYVFAISGQNGDACCPHSASSVTFGAASRMCSKKKSCFNMLAKMLFYRN